MTGAFSRPMASFLTRRPECSILPSRSSLLIACSFSTSGRRRSKMEFATVAVLGASQTEPGTQRFFGGTKSYPGQFTLRDARGIAVDSEHGRLFVTGSFSSRVVIFNFPRAAWKFDLGPKSLGYFHTPDAIDLEAREEALVVRHARIVSDGVDVSGTALVSVSEMFVDERTQRHSRMLVSEAAFAVGLPRSSMAFFIDGATDREHWLHVSSEPGTPAELMFRLLDMNGDELQRWQETVPADGQLGLVVEKRAGEVPESATLLLKRRVLCRWRLCARRSMDKAIGSSRGFRRPRGAAATTGPPMGRERSGESVGARSRERRRQRDARRYRAA